MQKKHKYILVGIVGLIFLIFLGSQLSKGLETPLITIKPQTLVNSFVEEGTIIPQLEHRLYAPAPQKVLELSVAEGQKVEAGQQLATLDTHELAIELRQLQLQYANQQEVHQSELNNVKLQQQEAQIQLDTAQKELAKSQSLYNAGAIAKQELEAVEQTVQLAQINLARSQEALRLLESTGPQALQTQIELLEHRISKARVMAPIDGIAANLNIKVGDLTPINQPLLTVFQNNFMVEAFILEEEAPLLQKAMEVTLIQDQKNITHSFTGLVENISPATTTIISPLGLEEQRVKVTISFSVPAELTIFPGAKLDVEFITAQAENVLVVPKTSLFTSENTEALWVVRQGKAHIQTVEKGLENARYVVIENGLEEGDQVIANPQLAGLKPGVRIKELK